MYTVQFYKMCTIAFSNQLGYYNVDIIKSVPLIYKHVLTLYLDI